MAIPGETLVEIFLNRVAQTPDLPAFRVKRNEGWQGAGFGEFGSLARETALGLVGLGIQKGDCVALLSNNRPEWTLCDVATMMAGAITVPVYSTNSADQVAYILSHCEAKVAFVEDQVQLDKIKKNRDRLPHLQKVILFEQPQTESDDSVMTLDQAKSAGAGHDDELESRVKSVAPDDLASIVYTSGTTGTPKGAMLSHRGFVYALKTSGEVLELKEGAERVLSYLPLSHIFERLNSGWGGICFGMEVWFAESLDKLLDNLKDCRPTFFIGVPRVYEKFYAGMKAKIEVHEKRHLIEKALELALEKTELEQAGRKVPLGLALKHRVLDKLVLSKLRDGIGMSLVRVAVTGGAPIEPEIMNFIRAIGLDLVEGYGLTETYAPIAITPPGKVRRGAVGIPIPGLEVKLDDDGEILVKGPNVFLGYFKDEEATGQAMTPDGFFRTGDVGEIDQDGYLHITDRKKDLIKTAAGKYIAPQGIESKLKLDPLIGQALVIGDRRPFPSALLTLDPDGAAAWAKEKGIDFQSVEQLARHPDLLQAIESRVQAVNEGLSQPERIKKWHLLGRDFTQEEEEITPSLKVRRKVVEQKYADEIESIYSPA